MNNNRNKTHELVIDINPRNRETIISDTTFFSMDANTGEKVIRFTRNHQAFDLTGVAVLIGFHFIDKWASKIIDSEDGSVEVIDAIGGKCSVHIPSHVYDYEGDVMVHVYLKFENGQSLDCGIIATRFERSWLDNELPEMDKFYVRRFEDLAREIRERVEELHRLLDDVEGSLVNRNDFNDHVNDRNNPHGVTTTQIGAAPVNHLHDASDIHVGVLHIARIPTGTTATTVATGNHTHPAQTTVSGNAGTATTLQTARTINGTSFNGSANITTANWGTARDITIGNTTRSVNGSGNLTWSLANIGAAATNHTHHANSLTSATPASANNSGRAVIGNLCIQWGQLSTANLATSTSTTNTINFTAPFAHTPNVQAIAHSTNFTCAIGSVNATSTTINTRHTVSVNAGVATVRWVAIGRLA